MNLENISLRLFVRVFFHIDYNLKVFKSFTINTLSYKKFKKHKSYFII